MNLYALFLAFVGFVILAVAWLPLVLRRLPLSLPIFCVLLGYGVFSLFSPGQDKMHPLVYPHATERLTELVVIVSLMGAGMKVRRPLGWKRWLPTWRLLAVTMPLSIAAMAVTGWWLLGLAPAAAVLIGAALAPTDPVLASDVQLGPPGSEDEDETRFALTSEAGLNDGLAFPFVHLALALAATAAGASLSEELTGWLSVSVLWKISAGVVAGYLTGRLFARLMFMLPERSRLAAGGDGFAVLGATLTAYGLTELAHGYGFLAVFIAAITLRRTEAGHEYHLQLHNFAEQVERLMMLLVLVIFGGMLAAGLLDALTWTAALAGLAFIFLVRPLCGVIALGGLDRPWTEKWLIAFFGIRGIGSFYYLAYALNHGAFENERLLWSFVGFVVLASIMVHGITVTPLMDRLHKRRSVD